MPDQPGRALRIFLTVFLFAFSLPGCDMIQQKMGLENPAAKAAKDEADGKAVGGACRQSGRAISRVVSLGAASAASSPDPRRQRVRPRDDDRDLPGVGQAGGLDQVLTLVDRIACPVGVHR